MKPRYSIRDAIRKALEKSIRYAAAGYCERCEREHDVVHHLTSVPLIAEEIFLWLHLDRDDLRLFGRLVRALEDARVQGHRSEDIPVLVDKVALIAAPRRPSPS